MERESPEVVLRYLDGRTVRGRLEGPFDPRGTDEVTVTTPEGERVVAPLPALKAVFFLKHPAQREADLAFGGREHLRGARARVDFVDGEVMRGLVHHYSVKDRGFMLVPTDPESNNERVFVVARAVQGVEIEG